MLPFPAPNDKRQYQCFICSQVQTDYQAFRKHITENHEEGREFLICPLLHCQAPVRDLRLHFKNKHPHNSLPPGIQLRASVWYDVRSPKRKKVPTFKSGTHISKTGKICNYRSGYELDVYKCLDTDESVRVYDAEPFPVSYFWMGEEKNYWPDIKVTFEDGHVEIWEVKPQNQLNLKQNKVKWDACKYFCDVRGWNFKVICEQDINKMKKKRYNN